jgi:hypothetical protein
MRILTLAAFVATTLAPIEVPSKGAKTYVERMDLPATTIVMPRPAAEAPTRAEPPASRPVPVWIGVGLLLASVALAIALRRAASKVER